MSRWGVPLTKGADNVTSIGMITAAAANMRRAAVYDLLLGCSASPADNMFIYQVRRNTDIGTATGRTPVSLDPADGVLSAGSTVCRDTFTADPTLSGLSIFQVAMNQRASMRWVASPGGEFIVPATANNGIVLGLSAATTSAFACGANFEER